MLSTLSKSVSLISRYGAKINRSYQISFSRTSTICPKKTIELSQKLLFSTGAIGHFAKQKIQDKPERPIPKENQEEVEDEENEVLTEQKAVDTKSIDDFPIPENIKINLRQRGIENLFPIQHETHNIIYEGKDLLGRARTGTGKTLAFALPLVGVLSKEKRAVKTPRVLVLAPTRELAKQTTDEFTSLSSKYLRTLAVYGGAAIGPQIASLRAGVDVIVGTPGRIKDLAFRGYLSFKTIKHVVLDEADEMLNMGFAEEIEDLLRQIPKENEVQTLMFSATVPEEIRAIMKKHLKPDYTTVDLVGDEGTRTAKTIEHFALCCHPHQRVAVLADVLKVHAAGGRAIVFVERKKDADDLANHPLMTQISRALHGDISQAVRESTLRGFKTGDFSVLIATDVAARGLDIPNVELVVNYSLPRDMDQFVHRVGRTGRAGKKGRSLSFYSALDQSSLKSFSRELQVNFTRISVPKTSDLITRAVEVGTEELVHSRLHPKIVAQFLDTAKKLIQENGAEQLVARALAKFSNFTSTTKELSLLGGFENHVTMRLHTSHHFRSLDRVYSMLDEIAPNIKEVKFLKEGGILFDCPVGESEEILEKFEGKEAFKGDAESRYEVINSIPSDLEYTDVLPRERRHRDTDSYNNRSYGNNNSYGSRGGRGGFSSKFPSSRGENSGRNSYSRGAERNFQRNFNDNRRGGSFGNRNNDRSNFRSPRKSYDEELMD